MIVLATRLRLLPTFRGQKNHFFFYLNKLNSNILTSVSKKWNLQKHSTYFEKRIFKQKSLNQEGVIISFLGESSEGTFVATAHLGAPFSCSCMLCLHCVLHKIHIWKLFGYRKVNSHGKIKSKGKSLFKKKKKKKLKEERKNAILSRTEKNPWWKRLVLAELHVGIQISNKEVAVKPKFVIQKVKTEVSFYSCKYQCWYKTNRLESYA